MSGEAARDAGAAFREYAVGRAVREVIVAMGDRAVYVVGAAPRGPFEARGERSCAPVVVVTCRDGIAAGPCAARGDVARLPVLSEAATGVWFDGTLDGADDATRRAALREAARLLQPGGLVAILVRERLPGLEALAAAAADAGLEVVRRVAVHRDDAAPSLPRVLWAMSARAARNAASRVAEDAPVTSLIVAERRNPSAPSMPDSREILRSMFVIRVPRQPPPGHSSSSGS